MRRSTSQAVTTSHSGHVHNRLHSGEGRRFNGRNLHPDGQGNGNAAQIQVSRTLSGRCANAPYGRLVNHPTNQNIHTPVTAATHSSTTIIPSPARRERVRVRARGRAGPHPNQTPCPSTTATPIPVQRCNPPDVGAGFKPAPTNQTTNTPLPCRPTKPPPPTPLSHSERGASERSYASGVCPGREGHANQTPRPSTTATPNPLHRCNPPANP